VPTLHDHATVGAGLSASVAAASSYGTLSSKVVVLDDEVGSEAILVGGTASNNTTVTMSWRERNADEVIGTYTNPPVQGAGVLISDVVQISGTGSDAYLLKVSYTWNPLDFGGVSESTAIANGWIRLMYLDPVTGGLNDGSGVNDDQWRFAAETTGGLFNYMGDHSPVLADGVGSFGVDTSGATHYAWAILDHGGQYAVVPEPSSVALLGLGAMGLLKRRRR
jgi:hypothetical protein